MNRHINCLAIFIVIVLSLSTALNRVYAQKILKVKGNKVLISTKSIDVSVGDVLSVTSDGYEAGKVKVLTVKSSTAIGKIISGSALAGDKVKVSESGGGDEDSSNDSEESGGLFSSSKKSSSGGTTSRGKWEVLAGYGLYMPSNISSEQGDYVLSGFSAMTLGAQYKMSPKTHLMAGVQLVSGTTKFESSATTLTITNPTVSGFNLFLNAHKFFTPSLYWILGGHYTTLSFEDTLTSTATSPTTSGAHTLDLGGVGGQGGAGYRYNLKPIFLQFEGLAEFNFYLFNKTTLPGTNQDFDTGTFSNYGLQLRVIVGYTF